MVVLAMVVGIGFARAQGSDLRQRAEQHHREAQQRIEETRQRIERDREDMRRRSDEMAREMRESRERREREARDRQGSGGANQGSSYGSSSRGSSWTPPNYSGAGSFPQANPGGAGQFAGTGVIPSGGVQINNVQVQPLGDDSAWITGVFQGLGEGLLRFVTGTVILGGLVFILAGFVLGRELQANESQVAIAVTLMLSSLVTLSTSKGPTLKPSAPGTGPALKRLEVPEGQFAIDMPEPRARTTGTAMGLGITQYSSVGKEGAYSIGWFDIPMWMQRPGQESFSIENGCTGAVQNMGNGMGTPTETRRTTVTLPGGHPGREVEGVLPRKVGKFRFRAYMVGRRFYFLSATGEDAWVGTPTTQRFLDSFALVPAR